MWSGKVTEELRALAAQYAITHDDFWPDEYDEICYEAMTYEEFVCYIKECLATGKDMLEVVP